MTHTKSYFLSVGFSGVSSADLDNLSIIVFHNPFFSSSICCRFPKDWKKAHINYKEVCFFSDQET